MNQAPLASSIVALGLLPVAVLYVHTFASGFRKTAAHRVTGVLAVSGDLVLSIFYMLFRTLGGQVQGSTFHPTGMVFAFFVFHGSIALIVILLELWIIVSAINYHRTKTMFAHHRWLSKLTFVLWFVTFLSGEGVYITSYLR
ncbi:MAG TPA: hypothetical protein VFL04_02215 [Rectinemataceae bacterium]|nr:hypothetical protein [Rectinemataceae bacterium]